MSLARSNPAASTPRGALWGTRLAVLGFFGLVLLLAGPRAYEVVAGRLRDRAVAGPAIALDQVGFARLPDWLDGALLLAVARDLEPWLQEGLSLLDDDGVRRLQAGLRTVPWIRDLAIERVFPDRFAVQIDIRRPVLTVRDGQGEPLCVCDRDGTALPFVEMALPTVFLYAESWPGTMRVVPGEVVDEPRVRAALGIVAEWQAEVAPSVPDCPALVEVDATNLGERYAQGPRHPEIRVKLRRSDGAPVVFAYDRPTGAVLPRVPSATKVEVLRKILAAHPGLEGLVAGDLRFAVRWQDWLQPRSGPDPAGPWTNK